MKIAITEKVPVALKMMEDNMSDGDYYGNEVTHCNLRLRFDQPFRPAISTEF